MPLFDLRYQLFLPFLAGIVSSTSRHQLLTRYFSCYSPRRRQPAHPTQCVLPTALLLCNCMICDAIWQADSLSWRWRAGGVFFFFFFYLQLVIAPVNHFHALIWMIRPSHSYIIKGFFLTSVQSASFQHFLIKPVRQAQRLIKRFNVVEACLNQA